MATKQKNIRFDPADLERIEQLYKDSKLKCGLGAYIAKEILGKTNLRSPLPIQKKPGNKRTERITFRTTPQQKLLFDTFYLQTKEKHFGDFIEVLINRGKIVQQHMPGLPKEQLTEIKKIGTNINQIARKLNTLKELPQGETEAIQAILSSLLKELTKISLT